MLGAARVREEVCVAVWNEFIAVAEWKMMEVFGIGCG